MGQHGTDSQGADQWQQRRRSGGSMERVAAGGSWPWPADAAAALKLVQGCGGHPSPNLASLRQLCQRAPR